MVGADRCDIRAGQPSKVKKARRSKSKRAIVENLEARAKDTHADRPVKRTDVPVAKKRAVSPADGQQGKAVKRANSQPAVIKRRKTKNNKKRAPQNVQQHPARGDAGGIKAQLSQHQRGQQLLNANGEPVRIQGGPRQPVRVAVQPPPPPPVIEYQLPETSDNNDNDFIEEDGDDNQPGMEDTPDGDDVESFAPTPTTTDQDLNDGYAGAVYTRPPQPPLDFVDAPTPIEPTQATPVIDTVDQIVQDNVVTGETSDPFTATVTVFASAETVTVTKGWHLFGRQMPTEGVVDPNALVNATIVDTNSTITPTDTPAVADGTAIPIATAPTEPPTGSDFDYGAAPPTPTASDPNPFTYDPAYQPQIFPSYASIHRRTIPLPQRVGRLPHKSRRIHEFRARAMGLPPPSNDTAGLVGAAMDAEYLVNVTIGGQMMQLIVDTGR